ncbi:MAG: hypothetical protein RIG84_19085 [Roseovarius sp.]
MALNPKLRELIDISKASMSREARTTFMKFMNRPKLANELEMLADELSCYGLECQVGELVTSEDALPEVAELAFSLEGYGRLLRDYVDAFEWLNYKGIEDIRKNSNKIEVTHRNGNQYDGLWYHRKGAHGTGRDIIYVFYRDTFDIGFVSKERSKNAVALHVKEAVFDLIDENEQEVVAFGGI